MPRKTKSVKATKSPESKQGNEPQPTLTEEQAASPEAPSKDRDPQGRFAAGNSGGPGNPHARHCARMLEVFRNTVSVEAFANIVRKLIEKAEAGDTSAAKIIVSYVVGKPLSAHHPDTIDRDEWDHYQKDAMNDKEMKLVMSALPTHVGNDIARVSLPIMTAARTRDLAKQLLKGCPGAKSSKTAASDEETEEATEPLSNGELNEEPDEPSTLHPSPATPDFDPWDIDAAMAASTAQPEGDQVDEIEDDKQEEEIAPIANGNSSDEPCEPTTDHHAPSTAKKPSSKGTKREGASSIVGSPGTELEFAL